MDSEIKKLDCYDFISFKQRLCETLLFTIIASILLHKSLKSITLPKEWEIVSLCRKRASQRIIGFRKFLLIFLTVIFGVEIGFSLKTLNLIELMNPCHLLTVVQIYLLSAEPTVLCTSIFRVHIHLISEVVFGCMIPNLYNIHAEMTVKSMTYWLQHITVSLVIPPYLIHVGGAFRCESLKDYTWSLLACAVYLFYKFYFLQVVAMVSLINVKKILCPTEDLLPNSPFYRIYDTIKQITLILLFSKLYTLVVYALMKLKDIKRRGQTDNDKMSSCYISTTIDNEKSK